jgi:hypothetical protein
MHLRSPTPKPAESPLTAEALTSAPEPVLSAESSPPDIEVTPPELEVLNNTPLAPEPDQHDEFTTSQGGVNHSRTSGHTMKEPSCAHMQLMQWKKKKKKSMCIMLLKQGMTWRHL